jgi:hypothetical protein
MDHEHANRRTGAVAGDKKMIRHCAYVIVAMGSLSLNGAFGQVTGVILDQTSKNLVRLHVGEAVSGWFLRSVASRTTTIEKDSRTVTMALPAPNSTPASLPVVSEAPGISREF